MAIRARDGTVIVLHEATIAAIVRAYIDIVTRPRRVAVRMLSVRLGERKRGYAEWQLLEAGFDEEALKRLEEILAEAEVPGECVAGEKG